ncbi:MAG: hypothetical protein MPW14_20730 [Candidatus Manganitrophus sp.]|nr:MAG: hypothetical protein MPW14_20730 [Candidatus Manganitrophus sp.]
MLIGILEALRSGILMKPKRFRFPLRRRLSLSGLKLEDIVEAGPGLGVL